MVPGYIITKITCLISYIVVLFNNVDLVYTQSSCLDECFCNLNGLVDDCGCDFTTIDSFNERIFPLLEEVNQRPYFNFYKVDLYRPCGFWQEETQCRSKGCAIDECKPNELPLIFLITDTLTQVCAPNETFEGYFKQNSDPSSPSFDDKIIPDLSGHHQSQIKDIIGANHNLSSSMTFTTNEEGEKASYNHIPSNASSELGEWYNLHANPERFTGYVGAPANKIWTTIYDNFVFNGDPKIKLGTTDSIQSEPLAQQKDCMHIAMDEQFRCVPESPALPVTNKTIGVSPQIKIEEMVPERRFFYRLVSGLHASIAVHIANFYYSHDKKQFIPSADILYRKFAPEWTDDQGPKRLRNLYYSYLVFLRAIEKLEPEFHNYTFNTGNAEEDSATKKLVLQIGELSGIMGEQRFNESTLFADNNIEMETIKKSVSKSIESFAKIMDCVVCTKCRLWGTIQVNGIKTALKILFTSSPAKLSRNELIHLLQTFNALSRSIHALYKFKNNYYELLDSKLSYSEMVALNNMFEDEQDDKYLSLLFNNNHSSQHTFL